MTTLRLLGISGSLRRESHCTAVIHTLSARMQGDVQLSPCLLDQVPLYNADLDGEHPPDAVRAFKNAIGASDGLVVCSPEYNYGMPGVLKNAIDWASRPGFKSPLRDKPVLIMTASPGTAGGVRAQYQIREAFSATMARPIARQHVAIPEVGKKIVDGQLTDPVTLEFIAQAINDLANEIRLLRRRG